MKKEEFKYPETNECALYISCGSMFKSNSDICSPLIYNLPKDPIQLYEMVLIPSNAIVNRTFMNFITA